jgi:hypothetical protein
MTIDSKPGEGTRLRAEVPLPADGRGEDL